MIEDGGYPHTLLDFPPPSTLTTTCYNNYSSLDSWSADPFLFERVIVSVLFSVAATIAYRSYCEEKASTPWVTAIMGDVMATARASLSSAASSFQYNIWSSVSFDADEKSRTSGKRRAKLRADRRGSGSSSTEGEEGDDSAWGPLAWLRTLLGCDQQRPVRAVRGRRSKRRLSPDSCLDIADTVELCGQMHERQNDSKEKNEPPAEEEEEDYADAGDEMHQCEERDGGSNDEQAEEREQEMGFFLHPRVHACLPEAIMAHSSWVAQAKLAAQVTGMLLEAHSGDYLELIRLMETPTPDLTATVAEAVSLLRAARPHVMVHYGIVTRRSPSKTEESKEILEAAESYCAKRRLVGGFLAWKQVWVIARTERKVKLMQRCLHLVSLLRMATAHATVAAAQQAVISWQTRVEARIAVVDAFTQRQAAATRERTTRSRLAVWQLFVADVHSHAVICAERDPKVSAMAQKCVISRGLRHWQQYAVARELHLQQREEERKAGMANFFAAKIAGAEGAARKMISPRTPMVREPSEAQAGSDASTPQGFGASSTAAVPSWLC